MSSTFLAALFVLYVIVVPTSVTASVTTRKEKAETIQPSSQQRAKNKINALTILGLKLLQKEARASFRPSELYTQQKGTNKMKESPHLVKAQHVHTATKIEGLRQADSTQGFVADVPSSFCDTDKAGLSVRGPGRLSYGP